LYRHDRAVFFDADLDAMLLLPRLVHRLEILRAVFYPTDGLAKMHRGERNQKIFRIEFTPGTETTADFRFDEMNAALRQTDQVGENAPVGMGHLGRPPHGEEPAALVKLSDQAARFQWPSGMTLGRTLPVQDQVTACQRRLDIADIDLEVGRDVIGHCVVKLWR